MEVDTEETSAASARATRPWTRLMHRMIEWTNEVDAKVRTLYGLGLLHPLKAKESETKAIEGRAAVCIHPLASLKARNNQHVSTTICGKCGIRVSYQSTKHPIPNITKERENGQPDGAEDDGLDVLHHEAAKTEPARSAATAGTAEGRTRSKRRHGETRSQTTDEVVDQVKALTAKQEE